MISLFAVPPVTDHVHSCLYVLDPDVIIPERTRNHHPPPAVAPAPARASTGAHASPVATRPRGGSDASTTHPPAAELAHYDDDPETGWARATLPQGELRVIRNLAERVNLLPIIGKADTLTAERLEAVKMAVRRDLQERGLTLGLIDPDESRHQQPHLLHQLQTTSGATPHASAARAPAGHPPTGPPPLTPRTYSAMPFAVMAPDRYLHGDGASKFRGNLRFAHSQLVQQYQAQVAAPNTVPQDIYVSPYIKPERVYRWGSLDVLDPLCSDFRQMRTMVFDNNLMVSDPGHASAVESINYCSPRVSENIHTGCSSPSTVPSLWAAVAIVRPAQRVLVCLTLRARHRQGPVY